MFSPMSFFRIAMDSLLRFRKYMGHCVFLIMEAENQLGIFCCFSKIILSCKVLSWLTGVLTGGN